MNDAVLKMTKQFSVLGVLAIFALMAAFGSYFKVDQGERGVVLRQGEFHSIAQPGPNFKVPFLDSVAHISTRTYKKTYGKLGSYSQDIQLADLRVSVNYRIDPTAVEEIYQKYRTAEDAIDRIITPRIARDVKIVFGQYTAAKAVSEREKLNRDIEDRIKTSAVGTGLIVENALVENIDFSHAFETSIEDRMKAEVAVAQRLQDLAKEEVNANIKRTIAKGEADKIRYEAKANADAVRMRGEAEAAAIAARGKALRDNPQVIELTKAEKWDGVLPKTMLPGGATPLIDLTK